MLESDLQHKGKNGVPLAFAKPTKLFDSAPGEDDWFSSWSFAASSAKK